MTKQAWSQIATEDQTHMLRGVTENGINTTAARQTKSSIICREIRVHDMITVQDGQPAACTYGTTSFVIEDVNKVPAVQE